MTGPCDQSARRPLSRRSGVRLRIALAAVCALAAVMIAAPPASAALYLQWTSGTVEGDNGPSTPFHLGAVSCPSSRACAAVDNMGNVLVSTDPVATTGKNAASIWKKQDIDGTTGLSGISCLPSLCVAVDHEGNMMVSANPFQPKPTWSTPLPIDPFTSLAGISCPATNLCVAVDSAGRVLTSTQPSGGLSKWKRGSVGPGNAIDVVSCASTKLCVAFDRLGNSMSSTNPASGSSTWKLHPAVDKDAQLFDVQSLDCVSSALCVGVDETGPGGSLLTSTTPTTNTAWKAAPLDTNFNTPFGVSCPSSTFCVMVDDAGRQFESTNPTGGVSAWTKGPLDSRWSLLDVSCSPRALCVAVDQGANVFVGHLPPPDTAITHSTINKSSHSASFKFTSTGLDSGFQCELRKKGKPAKFGSCTSPKTYRHLAAGSYTFLVRAFNLAGPDPTPDSQRFTLS